MVDEDAIDEDELIGHEGGCSRDISLGLVICQTRIVGNAFRREGECRYYSSKLVPPSCIEQKLVELVFSRQAMIALIISGAELIVIMDTRQAGSE
jgi:hypothetical protein